MHVCLDERFALTTAEEARLKLVSGDGYTNARDAVPTDSTSAWSYFRFLAIVATQGRGGSPGGGF
jgi:hypothetical protein